MQFNCVIRQKKKGNKGGRFYVCKLTLKKSHVEPCNKVPYCTSVCMAKSSGELMGVTMRSTVRKAAKLAVYEEIKMSVKNHQTAPTIRPDIDRGDTSQPCCMKAANENQNEFNILKSLTAADVAGTGAPVGPVTPGVTAVIGPGTGTPPIIPGGC